MIVAASPDGKVLYVVTSGPNGYEIETISLTSNPPTISNTTIFLAELQPTSQYLQTVVISG
ncbi:unnamed protein product [Acidithrix sp. C25]|nr:unnamed protein product [Acidithrix sp. C25]